MYTACVHKVSQYIVYKNQHALYIYILLVETKNIHTIVNCNVNLVHLQRIYRCTFHVIRPCKLLVLAYLHTSVNQTLSSSVMCHHHTLIEAMTNFSIRVGEKDSNGGLPGNPVQAERAEQRQTPRVTAESAIQVHQGTVDSSNPQDPRQESGDQGGAQAELRRFLSRRPHTSGVHFSENRTTNKFVAGEGERSVRDWVSLQSL